jgi:DNA-binding PadR family transcriptional regulator
MIALGRRPTQWRYGYELATETGLKTGTVYPILIRLGDRGLLEAKWKHVGPSGRPPRHIYRLTAKGRAAARELAAANPPAAKGKLGKSKPSRVR